MDDPTQSRIKVSGLAPGDIAMQPVIQKLNSATLFAGAKELVIAHAGQEYRLRQTSQGKLILTK